MSNMETSETFETKKVQQTVSTEEKGTTETSSPKNDHNAMQRVWANIVAQMRFEYGNEVFMATFGGIEFLGLKEDTVHLNLSPVTDANWAEHHARNILLNLWQKEFPHIQHIKFSMPAVSLARGSENEKKSQEKQQKRPLCAFRINKNLTFDNFIVGTSNLMAYRAAQSIAHMKEDAISPLYLHGKVGLGKTHLLHSIAATVQQRNRYAICLVPAERFMNAYVDAILRKEIMSFKNYFRSLDVLLIDDLHFLSHKEKAQEELLHTLNDLIDSHCRIVVASTCPPNLLESFDERIRSRLSSGLVAQLKPYNAKERLAIIRAKNKQKNSALSEHVMQFLAEEITTDVRDIEGAVNHVVAYQGLAGEKPLHADDLRRILKDVTRSKNKNITVEDVQVLVARYFEIKTSDLQSASRQRNVVIPRHIAMYLAKENTRHSLTAIGRSFGKRDHSTVQHAINRIQKELSQNNIAIQQDIETLTEALQQD